MKKITLLAAVVIAASFASCKKNYTCVCTYTSAGTTETYTYDLGKIKKKDATTLYVRQLSHSLLYNKRKCNLTLTED